jgi:hypothetical protein
LKYSRKFGSPGISVDEEKVEKPPIIVNFKFYSPGTNYLLFNFSSNASGYYNESIDARFYDLQVNVWNESVKMFNASILTNVFNPIIFGSISSTLIGKGSLKGMAIDTILGFDKARIKFDYSTFTWNYRKLPRNLPLQQIGEDTLAATQLG